jgi:hypothetical protein
MLNHTNRVRRQQGKVVIRETQTASRGLLAAILPTEDEIRRRAHEIYLRRNGKPGNAVLDWLEAEQELRLVKQLPARAG